MTCRRRSYGTGIIILVVVLAGLAPPAEAHFLWLRSQEVGDAAKAALFFAETGNAADYRVPEGMKTVEIQLRLPDGTTSLLRPVEEDRPKQFAMVAKLPSASPCSLDASWHYGEYHGAELTYYARHLRCTTTAEANSIGTATGTEYEIIPHFDEDRVRFTVVSSGQPQPDAKVSVWIGDEQVLVESAANAEGTVEYPFDSMQPMAVLAGIETPAEPSAEEGKSASQGEVTYISLTIGNLQADE